MTESFMKEKSQRCFLAKRKRHRDFFKCKYKSGISFNLLLYLLEWNHGIRESVSEQDWNIGVKGELRMIPEPCAGEKLYGKESVKI